MTALLAISVPSALLTLALEMRDGRLAVVPGTIDGGIVIGIGAIIARLGGII